MPGKKEYEKKGYAGSTGRGAPADLAGILLVVEALVANAQNNGRVLLANYKMLQSMHQRLLDDDGDDELFPHDDLEALRTFSLPASAQAIVAKAHEKLSAGKLSPAGKGKAKAKALSPVPKSPEAGSQLDDPLTEAYDFLRSPAKKAKHTEEVTVTSDADSDKSKGNTSKDDALQPPPLPPP